MPASTAKKKTKKTPARAKRRERRFVPNSLESSKLSLIGGGAGALALGAGVYGPWIREPAVSYATYLVAGGALVLGAAMWFGDVTAHPVRVGDAGVAIERGTELSRLAWCDIERIRLEGDKLLISGEGLTLELPMSAHKVAISWLLKEAAGRVPDVVDVKGSVVDGLPEPRDTDGERLEVKDVQVAGRRCAESDQLITFERDARLCPNCGQVYHLRHVPKKCVTCDEALGSSAIGA